MDSDLMPLPSLGEWLLDIAAAKVVLNPGDIRAEARGNLWSFSLSSGQARACSVDGIEGFVRQAVDINRSKLHNFGVAAGSVAFYCWHDEQAAQLRFSLVSASHGELPFGCTVVPCVDLRQIVASFLGSPYHDGIPGAELEPESAFPGAATEPRAHRLDVWSTPLP